jgi:hypothetical protein
MGKKWVCLVLALVVLGPALAVKATPGPVGWWTLDEKTGTTAADSSANKNNGTLTGGATWATGQIGGAVQLNGTDGYVSLPIGSLISKLTSSTFAIWANFQSGGSWTRILDFGTGQNVNMFLTPAVGTAGNLRFAITTGGSGAESQLNAPAIFPAGWHHVAVVFNGDTRGMQLFLDGAVVATATTTTLPSALGNTTQNWLGRSQYPADGYYRGMLDDFRIYDRVLTQSDIQTVMRGGGYGTAGGPHPADKATDVLRDAILSWTPGQFAKTHDVYFGASVADVNSASRTKTLNVLASQGQDANSYDPPGVLGLGMTYYWRVDEVNAVPTTIFKGDIWSFTVEPVSYPLKTVTATASSSANGMGPEKTINGVGLNANDQHSTTATDMWMTAKGTALPAWIQYTFDKAYKLDKLLVWNSNQALESILGLGADAVTVEYSADGATWKALGDFEFTQAPGSPDYTADTTVNFKGVAAQAVKLTIKSNWGGILPQVGLSEVRFYYIPVWAREPSPASAATAVTPQAPLTWRAGREAASHKVYVSTDKQKVLDGTAPAATVTGTQYQAPITLGQTYYWKVTEVNQAMTPASWDGDVWSFTTADSLVVDNFESYTDKAGSEIFSTWIDGVTNGLSGSQVGYLQAPFAERVLVHGGRQSMPMMYDNNKAPHYSEAERTFAAPQDWSQYGITTLVLWFRGDANNTPAPLYAKINGTKVLFNNGAPSTAFPVWKQWNIDLASTGTNLKSVKTLAVGVGDGQAGGAGTIFVDDILLYATAPQVVVPADPGTNGLVLLYAMEGNVQDTSGKNNNGTLNGTAAYVNGPNGYGKALKFNGLDNYVTLPIGNLLSTLSNITVATWVNWSGTGGGWQRVWDFGSGPPSGPNNYMFLTPAQGTTGPMTFAIMSPSVAEKRFVARSSLPTGWHHTAVVIDGTAMTATVYLDGSVVATNSVAVLPKNLGVTTQNWIGRSQYPADAFFNGSVDDFRIYNRAMSASEIRYLAGDR